MNERYPQQSFREPVRDKPRPATAIALHYSGRGAPRVTATGNGLVAQKIIETAKQHGVPLEEDAALASALSKVELGREIPRELWVAVAHVLTFAWGVAGKKQL
jgi:flagellar biosynthesis protein